MLNMVLGQRVKIVDLNPTNQPLKVKIKIATSSFDLDFSCFGLDESGKLSDDRYMTFFNQPQTPCGAIKIIEKQTLNALSFEIDLSRLPTQIDRLVLTASIDGQQTMAEIGSGQLQIFAQNQMVANADFQAEQFHAEKALMLGEFYRKDGLWRFAIIGQGFNGGLAALVSHFGGSVANDTPPTTVSSNAAGALPAIPSPAPSPVISLINKIEQAAPQLVSLAKKATMSLEKNQLTQIKAQVGLVLDASGSMHQQYVQGFVQEVIERLLPLAVHFDDDGTIECWAFGEKPTQLDSISLANVKNYVETNHAGWKKWKVGARFNDEPKVIEQVIQFFQKNAMAGVPIYILFISDGGVGILNSRKIKTLISDAAKLPIFWQFVGIGGSNYGILEQLDDLNGRVVDNCNFFSLDRLHDVDEQRLYDLMLQEFPLWLKDAKQKGIL